MAKYNLTDAFVKSAKPHVSDKTGNPISTDYPDAKEPGLALRVSHVGGKSWTYRYTLKGSHERRRIALGKVLDVSLADARILVAEHRLSVAKGGDPVNDAKVAKLQAVELQHKETVKDVGEWYFEECKKGRHKVRAKRPKRESTVTHEYAYFERLIVPTFGTHKLDSLTKTIIQGFVNDLADNQSNGAARQCRVILHAIFAFAQYQEILEKNPVHLVDIASYNPRERILTDTELKTIWQTLTPPVVIAGASISASVAYSVLLAMVTLQRRGEVTGMSLEEIDRDRRLWIIPSNRTKNHRTHTVPLSDLALELIDKALVVRVHESAYVFPSPRDAEQPIKPAAMTRAFGRMKKALDLGDIRPHDLRRTGATNLTSEHLGFARFTVSKVLNHASDTGGAAAVTGIYDQNEYLSEKRRALDAWALRILKVVDGTIKPDNVIALR